MTEFTPVASFAGGLLIGAAALGLLAFAGRIAGISGIFGGLLRWPRADAGWRLAFVLGLLAGGTALALFYPPGLVVELDRPYALVVLAGVLVGAGTRLGGGCTSGHGVCGVGRLSRRSILATATFVIVGAVTATLIGPLFAGLP